jgi:hypothetical protein
VNLQGFLTGHWTTTPPGTCSVGGWQEGGGGTLASDTRKVDAVAIEMVRGLLAEEQRKIADERRKMEDERAVLALRLAEVCMYASTYAYIWYIYMHIYLHIYNTYIHIHR